MVTVGVFAMIAVFAVIDSLEKEIRDSVSALGDDVIYIQKWPWEFSADYAWWEYWNRPQPSIDEYEAIKENAETVKSCAFMSSSYMNISQQAVNMSAAVLAATHDYQDTRVFDISRGRYFSETESSRGANVAIIGHHISKSLFNGVNPVGKQIKIKGQPLTVIGVFDKEGSGMMSTSHDYLVLIPVKYAKRLFDVESMSSDPLIIVNAKEGVDINQMSDELEILMRAQRRLKPMEDINFALNQASMIAAGVDKIFAAIDLAGIIIGGFAILVGGFGIANIMFVSVKERTRIIGIQKAIGAKSGFIMVQFLFEAVVLSLLGGILGLILIWIGTKIGTKMAGFDFILSLKNIALGIFISGAIGILSGFWPARKAAKLDPVVAMNQV